jgi:glycine/D-amino acid oxidase-like deaminating enzyme
VAADPILPHEAPAVVIGGGVIGTSILFHLAEAGVPALLLERGSLAGGSTSKAAGGVRAQFSDDLNIAIAQRSLELFGAFGRRPGAEIDLHRVGYLFLLTKPEHVRAFETGMERQHAHGVPSRLLTPAEAVELCPLLQVDDVMAAAFSPDDGHCTPEAVVAGYATAARALGGQVALGCELRGIEITGGDVHAVETSRGRVETPAVICAAGPWSAAVGEMAGVELPVAPLRRQVLFTGPMDGLPARLPMTIDFETGFYFHREGPGLLMGMADPDETPGFRTEPTDDWIPALMEVVERRVPRIADAGISGGWAGLYEVTPDHNALIGEASAPRRFLYATGFSGHGFLQGPAVGEIVRDLFLRRTPLVDPSPLSADRFAAGALRPEVNVV